MSINFQNVYLGEITDANGIRYYAIEDYIKYPYIKFNNNFGHVLNTKLTEEDIKIRHQKYLENLKNE